ncbi:hypothetical protein PC1C4_28910 [Paraprevotella clara]|nr:hypothetical protein PC1C4_28910 [Paraprevotella clara]
MERRNEEESRAERMLRDLLMERYETAGPTERMVVQTTAELVYMASETIPEVSATEAAGVAQYLGAGMREIGGVAHWVFYERRDPIEDWR